MAKARKIKPGKPANHKNLAKNAKRIQKNEELLKKLKVEYETHKNV